MGTRICWNCGSFTHMTRVGEPFPVREIGRLRELNLMWFALFTCDSCGFGSMGAMTISAHEALMLYGAYDEVRSISSYGGSQAEIDRVAVGCAFDDKNTDIMWYPVKAVGKTYENVPENIASAASEAYSCLSISANRAATILARAVIEATGKEKNIPKQSNLRNLIDKMAEVGIITDLLKDEAHEIRFLGNDMAHGDFDHETTAEDAEEILGFMDSVLNYVYVQPEIVARRKRKREQQKQQDNGKI